LLESRRSDGITEEQWNASQSLDKLAGKLADRWLSIDHARCDPAMLHLLAPSGDTHANPRLRLSRILIMAYLRAHNFAESYAEELEVRTKAAEFMTLIEAGFRSFLDQSPEQFDEYKALAGPWGMHSRSSRA
jgi:hypothetical protein